MKVKDLRDALKDLPDDMVIILQNAEEDNEYSPLHGADPDCIYCKGEVYPPDWKFADDGFTAREIIKLLKNNKVLVLYSAD